MSAATENHRDRQDRRIARLEALLHKAYGYLCDADFVSSMGDDRHSRRAFSQFMAEAYAETANERRRRAGVYGRDHD